MAITVFGEENASHGWDLPRTSPDSVQRLEDKVPVQEVPDLLALGVFAHSCYPCGQCSERT